MKKVLLLAIISCILLSGCMTVKVVAPPGKNITLLTETDASALKLQKEQSF